MHNKSKLLRLILGCQPLQPYLEASGVDDAEPHWSIVFAKAFEGQDVSALLANIGLARGCGDKVLLWWIK